MKLTNLYRSLSLGNAAANWLSRAGPAGHATASAALQRLNRFQASKRFYAANRELGRALKTEFVLQYMSEPQLRAKVRRGLSRSSSSTPWRGPSTTGSEGASAPERSTTR